MTNGRYILGSVGSSGQACTVANSGANVVTTGGTAVLTNTPSAALIGTLGARLTSTTTSGGVYFEKTLTAGPAYAADAYVYIEAYPSATNQPILAFLAGSTRGVNLALSTTGQLLVLDRPFTVITTLPAIPLNTLVRVALYATLGSGSGTDGTVRAAWYTGHSATPTQDSGLLTGRNTGAANLSVVRWGAKTSTGTATCTLVMSSYAWDDAATGLTPPYGTALTASQDDQIGISDVASAAIGTSQTVDDPVGITDTPGPQVLDVTQSLDEPVGLADAAGLVLDAARTSGDTSAITDSATAIAAVSRDLADPAGVTDAISGVLDAARGAADSATITDIASAAMIRSANAVEPVGIVDSASATLTTAGAASLTDQVGLTDSATSSLDRHVGATEPVGISDAPQVDLGLSRGAEDAVGLSDSVTAVLERVVTADDLLDVIDQATAAATLARAAADDAMIGDVVEAVLTSRADWRDIIVRATEPHTRLAVLEPAGPRIRAKEPQ